MTYTRHVCGVLEALKYTWPMSRYIRPMLRYIGPMLSYIRLMLSYIRPHKALVEVHRTLGNHRNSRELLHAKVQRLSKHQYMD